MPKFVFQLEAVLRQRKHAEQQCQREMSPIQAKLAAFDLQLREMDASVRATNEDMRASRLTGRLDLNFLAAHRRYAFSMQRKALALAQQMAVVHRQLAEAQKKLTEAVKRRKALEKLREKQFERWREFAARGEIHEMDEVALQMARLQQSQIDELEENAVASGQAGAA